MTKRRSRGSKEVKGCPRGGQEEVKRRSRGGQSSKRRSKESRGGQMGSMLQQVGRLPKSIITPETSWAALLMTCVYALTGS
eukprot:CAMPEP_0174756920 /NCGR_PEP_ID=MMETSP1094-20130205/107001_1 /TAXON_ID=156173 /ORGANISM="Chrysochromulina brevifilum, Strain UTEX LB 985" /LENGTH=80 /DNA_ID=CAMNT_0015962835 /DNA_START=307 /DNA_END=549 /DNA_ORIENTATION=-